MAALEQLQVAVDHAQRLGEVVRGDVGELLELGVGALELARVLGQRALGLPLRAVTSRHLAMPPRRCPSSSTIGMICDPPGDAVGAVEVEAASARRRSAAR